ncbi:MAG: N-acetylmuramoyl-L-alanine amidase [Prevotella sp.]|nr:N-acetylmuramoyl-L-alanine amidase [Prevotella sp.]
MLYICIGMNAGSRAQTIVPDSVMAAPVMSLPDSIFDGGQTTDTTILARRPSLDCIACRIPVVDMRREVDYGHDTLITPKRQVDIIVIHSNYHVGKDVYSTRGCIDQFKQYDVAPHFMITRDGTILYMVDEQLVAWHAGQSLLPGTSRDSLNYTSIGIELVAHPDQQLTKRQTDQLVRLVCDIRQRYHIRYLMRHSDISPRRKRDPWSIDWPRFCRRIESRSGFVIWRR